VTEGAEPLSIIEAHDLDAALARAREATVACLGPIPPMADRVDADRIGRAFRAEAGRVVASLVRLFGDIDLAEDSVQDPFEIAL
jgi:hypothetical protein